MPGRKIAICDDEMLIRLWLEEHLAHAGFDVCACDSGTSLLEDLERDPADLVLLDLRLPDGSGLDVLERVRQRHPGTAVVMMSAFGEVEVAVDAVRKGAFHFLEKPIELPELILVIDQALENRQLVTEIDRYRQGNAWGFRDVILVGRSFAIRRIAEVITQLASRGAASTVLIRGESGTGKDVVARAVHAQGSRRDRPFISVNCSAIPDALVESELFGHESGAFTGARGARQGLFELADGGTLFLDEIGDMTQAAQAKLLHALERRTLRRVGGSRDVAIDVHVIAATNHDLDAAVQRGDFREDLFYRLNVVPIEVPPLRHRPEDVIPLALHFLDVLVTEMRLPPRILSAAALKVLESYAWPGNARQLRNVLERILLLDDRETIEVDMLPPELSGKGSMPGAIVAPLPPEGIDLQVVERTLLSQALSRAEGNKSQAARLLGLSRDTFRYRLEKYSVGGGSGRPP